MFLLVKYLIELFYLLFPHTYTFHIRSPKMTCIFHYFKEISQFMHEVFLWGSVHWVKEKVIYIKVARNGAWEFLMVWVLWVTILSGGCYVHAIKLSGRFGLVSLMNTKTYTVTVLWLCPCDKASLYIAVFWLSTTWRSENVKFSWEHFHPSYPGKKARAPLGNYYSCQIVFAFHIF